MDFDKYFSRKYELGKCDCWTLMQDIYSDEHKLKLPDSPIILLDDSDTHEFASFLKSNLDVEQIDKAEKGALIHFLGIREHVGYCLNEKQYIHRLFERTKVDNIPDRKAIFYRIKGVK